MSISRLDDNAWQKSVGRRQQPRKVGKTTEVIQLKLPRYEDVPEQPARRHRRHVSNQQPLPTSPNDLLVEIYLSRLRARGVAQKGFQAYRYQLRVIAHVAARRTGRLVLMEELFRDPQRLGEILVEDVAPVDGSQLSKWTLAQRRSAIRSFANLMRPELRTLIGQESNIVLDQALRSVAVRIGGGYQLTGGAPRRKGGAVPAPDEISLVLRALAESPGYLGLRNRCFFSILGTSGARVNALRELDGADCVEMPSGRLRIFIHDKGGREPREVELSRDLSALLQTYIAEFNVHAARQYWKVRIRIGQPGAIWRNSERGRWSYNNIRHTLAVACEKANVTPFRPHAFRRAFATEAASVVPRYVVAQAGGWQGVERLDNHYIRPELQSVADKLNRRRQDTMLPQDKEKLDGATAPVQFESYRD